MGTIITGIIFALIAAIGWGASAVLSRIALEKTDPRLATIVSLFFSSIIMFSLSLSTQFNEFEKLVVSDFLWFFSAGLTSFAAGRLLNYVGIKNIGVSKASPLFGTSPLFAALLAIIILNENPTIMLGMGIISVLLMSYNLSAAIAEFYWYKAKRQFANGQIHNSESNLDLGAKWNPNSLRIRFQQVQLYRSVLNMIKNEASEVERKKLMGKGLMVLKIIEDINKLDGFAPENRGHLLVENSDIAIYNWYEKAMNEYKNALRVRPEQYRARIALAKLLEQQGKLDEAVDLMNDGVNYFYRFRRSGFDEFYQYAIKLNLMNGDTVKAREIQLDKRLLPVNQ